ncbi:MAG: hypothetical protein QOE54_435 [Streptosporangiaceae bacterium]|jgi:hypothetical protein|nr:hypothetical protein [Streptosporangiaceae bacterium]MDX6428069.1 hypothetical protein [Streptosporangiaceae bacterium]
MGPKVNHAAMGLTREGSYTDRVIAQVTSWSSVSAGRAECGMGVGLSVNTRQIVHLHSQGGAHVRLTRPVILRMEDALLHSGRVEMEPSEDWVSVRLDSDSDVALLLSLVSVAIKATAAEPPGVARRAAPQCPAAAHGRTWGGSLGRASRRADR